MNARRIPAVLVSFASLSVLASCGSTDSGVTSGTSATPTPSIVEYPSDPDDAIVRVGAPQYVPSLVIGGDGWAYQRSEDATTDDWTSTESRRRSIRPLGPAGVDVVGAVAVPAAAPSPPEPMPMQRRLLTPDGVQTVLALADELGLLAVPDEYEDPGVTDAGSTYVMLTDADGSYEHDAYALGIDDETGNRRNLEQFVDAVADLETLVGAENIGPAEAYVPALFSVSVAEGYTFDDDSTWPAGVAIEEGCVPLATESFPAGVAGLYTADTDDDTIRITVIPDLPGDDC